MPTRSPWLETSKAERAFGIALAAAIRRSHSEPQDQLDALEAIGSAIGAGDVRDLERHVSRAASTLSLDRWFADDDATVTTNVVAAVAHELGRAADLHDDAGVVATPPTLARDMVALAAWLWLTNTTGLPPAPLADVLFDCAEPSQSLSDQLATALQQATWYDPCVGGGVFALAIMDLLGRIGALRDSFAPSRVLCRDANPFAVAATRIRLALSLVQKTGASYEDVYGIVADRVKAENALAHYAEQKPLSYLLGGDHDEPPVDIVVGNPPYVRAERLQQSLKEELANLYPSVSGGQVDLSSYFIAHGLQALKPDGIVCYVSSASFQKSRYGAKIRSFIAGSGTVKCVFDFHELPVFSDASVHTSVYAVARGSSPSTVITHAFKDLPQTRPLSAALAEAVEVPPSAVGRDGWNIGHAEKRDVLDALEHGSTSLVTFAGPIYSGIKSGHKHAYVLTQDVAGRMLADELSAGYVKPMLRPVSMRRWRSTWDGSHMAVIPKGVALHKNSLIFAHLANYENQLRSRTDTLGHPTWYGLRECSYYSLFAEPKLVFPDIAAECRFAIDDQGFVFPDGAFFIPNADDFLVALLNSCVGRYYFRVRCNSIGNPLAGDGCGSRRSS